jgi:hypothetical protein
LLQEQNGGTRTRENPAGNGTKEKERLGNEQARTVARLCWLQWSVGNFFSIENPDSSKLWFYDPIKQLSEIAKPVRFDQCCFSLRPPKNFVDNDSVYIKKPTRLLTNMEQLLCLQRTCPGTSCNHKHRTCWGKVRTTHGMISVAKAAGSYPNQLCAAWAEGVRVCALAQ